MGAKAFGTRVTRVEHLGLLSGRGRDADDFAPPGVLQACFVRGSAAQGHPRRPWHQAKRVPAPIVGRSSTLAES
jgi:hypothetical protein